MPTFSDIPEDHPYYDAIEWAAANGITIGYPDGTYQSDRAVSRGEMAVFLQRNKKSRDAALDWGVQYVHPDGSDSNDGLTPSTPKATIESAYGDSQDGGAVHLANGQRYDIGDGIAGFDRQKVLAFAGPGKGGRRSPTRDHWASAPRIFSSTGVQTMFDFSRDPEPYFNAYGWAFTDIDFEISSTTTLVFQAREVNQMRLTNCGYFHSIDDTVRAPFLVIDADTNNQPVGGEDASWWRIYDNYVINGVLLKATGQRINQWVVDSNVVFPGTSTDPMIHFNKAHRCVITNNNLEGNTTGILLENAYGCMTSGNGGEETSPFVSLLNSSGNMIMDMGAGVSYTRTDLVYVRLVNSQDNLIVTPVGTGFHDNYGRQANWIEDDAPMGNNWFVAPGSFGWGKENLPLISRGHGNPNGAVTGKPGALYADIDTGDLFVKDRQWDQYGWVGVLLDL